MSLPQNNKLCICQCNDIVNSWEQRLYIDWDKLDNPRWHDEDGNLFPAIVHSWQYAALAELSNNTKLTHQ